MRRSYALAITLALAAVTCRPSPSIGPGAQVRVAAFKLEGNELKRVVKPGDKAIIADKHYVSIAVEEVRVDRGNLPKPLALAMKIQGALPRGREFQAIIGRIINPDSDGYYSFRRPAIIDPFVYRGQPLVIEIALAPCSEAWAEKIKAAKKKWGDVRHIDPGEYKAHEVDATHLGTDGSNWFKASFGTMADPSALPLVAGQYVIFAHPNPEEIRTKVIFDDRGLVWKDSNNRVKGVSFATIFVNRRSRGPRRESNLESAKRRLDILITNGKIAQAQSLVQTLPDLINRDPHKTNPEKDLERDWLKIHLMRIEWRSAQKAKDKATFESKANELIAATVALMKKYDNMLEPFERSRLKSDRARYRRLRDLGF